MSGCPRGWGEEGGSSRLSGSSREWGGLGLQADHLFGANSFPSVSSQLEPLSLPCQVCQGTAGVPFLRMSPGQKVQQGSDGRDGLYGSFNGAQGTQGSEGDSGQGQQREAEATKTQTTPLQTVYVSFKQGPIPGLVMVDCHKPVEED